MTLPHPRLASGQAGHELERGDGDSGAWGRRGHGLLLQRRGDGSAIAWGGGKPGQPQPLPGGAGCSPPPGLAGVQE